MAHDKIKAAARRRMAQTGESYAAARRQVIREFQAARSSDPARGPLWFAISYDDMGPISTWTDTLLGGGPAGGRIEIDAGELRLRMADFKVDVPRASVRRAARSALQTRGTIGVHAKGGRWLANGSGGGLVAIEIDPPLPHRAQPQHLVPPDEGHRTDRESRRSGRLHRRGPA
jgi:hypothetical protein